MYMVDYEKIVIEIDPELSVYREDDYVYLLYPNSPKNGNILFQETEQAFIVWSNEYKTKSMLEVLSIIVKHVDADIIFPFLETEEEYQAVIALGAVPTEFETEDCEDLCRDFGSFILKKRRNNEI